MPDIARMGRPERIVEQHSSNPIVVGSCPPPIDEAEDDVEGMKQFVEQYLRTRGCEMTTRNARMVVAALATAAGTTDWAALEHHVDGKLDREQLRRAA